MPFGAKSPCRLQMAITKLDRSMEMAKTDEKNSARTGDSFAVALALLARLGRSALFKQTRGRGS